MTEYKTVSVIGGDLRQLTLVKLLEDEGYKLLVHGFDDDGQNIVGKKADLADALAADIIILPMPVSCNGSDINAPYSSAPIPVTTLLDGISPSAIVFGGQIYPELANALDDRGIVWRDYLKREEFAVKNAVPTAEGAVEIAISETPITISGSKCLVLGYGRIGKILSKMLSALGAEVYTEARKHSDLAMIEGFGHKPLHIDKLKRHIGEFDIIFNTVPAMVLEGDLLKSVKKDALIIDLASKPGGAELNLNCIFLHTKIKINFNLFTLKNFDFIYQYRKHIRCCGFKQ